MPTSNARVTALVVFACLAALLGVAEAYLAMRASPPTAFDQKLREAVAAFENRRWEPPPLAGETEREAGNGFDALKKLAENQDVRDLGLVFESRGRVARDLESGELSKASRRAVTRREAQAFVENLRGVTRHTWSWSGGDLARYAAGVGKPPGFEHGPNAGIGSDFLFRSTRLLAADALRHGGGTCLRRAAELVRIVDYATVGGPLPILMRKSAAVGYLRYLVPTCASRAGSAVLSEARRRFRRLVEHPAPAGAALEAEVLTTTLGFRQRVGDAGPIPMTRREFQRMWRAPNWYVEMEQALDARTVLRDVTPAKYPQSTRALDQYGESLSDTTFADQSTMLRRFLPNDQEAQNVVRAALLTVAHYVRLDADAPSGDPGPPELLDSPAVRDAVTGDPMQWIAEQGGRYQICFRLPTYGSSSDSDRSCWQLPPQQAPAED